MKRILATAKFIDVPASISEDSLVITPNAAAAAKLRVPHCSLTKAAQEILNREHIGIASPLRSLYVLRSITAQIFPDRDPAAEASRIRPILATVLRDNLDIEAMRASGSVNAKHLADVAESYRSELWKAGLIDPDSVLWTAGGLIQDRRKMLVYGYFRARGSDIRFINKLAGDESIFVVPSATGSIFASTDHSIDWLIGQGWSRTDPASSPNHKGEKIAAQFAADPEGSRDESICEAFAHSNIDSEVRAALAAAKELIVGGSTPGDIALVCRKAADYERTVKAVAREYGISVTIQSKAPLADTKLGSCVSLVLEAATENFSFAPTARVLRHPYGMHPDDESWNIVRRQRPDNWDEWTSAGIDLMPFAAGTDKTYGGWISWLLNLVPLTLIRERSSENAAELVAFESFREALDEFAALDSGQPVSLAEFSVALQEVLAIFTTPTAPGRGGIAFHQPNTIIGGEFDHVFILGLAEGMLPAITNEDAVIDFHEQRELEKKGVMFDRPAEFPRWEALSFYYVLLTGKKSVVLSYPKAIEVEVQLPSPFFERIGVRPVHSSRLSAASPREELKIFLRRDDAPDNEVFKTVKHRLTVEQRRESSLPYDEFDGVTGIAILPESRIWSASQLTKLGQCPFKWFAEKVLRLAVVDEADTDLRSSVMGRLYHKTLQLAVDRALGSNDFRSAVLLELEAAFRQAESDEEIAVSELPNWKHRRSEHLAALKKAVETPDFIGEGSRVVATEKEFEANWNGFGIRGRIDRVDETNEGRFIAIDYKTGTYVGRVKGATGELETDIQLPIYSRLGLESLYPGSVADGHYFSLKQTKILKQKPADLESFGESIRQVLEAGAFAVDPDGSRKSCKYCEYDPVCRQGQRNKRKKIRR